MWGAKRSDAHEFEFEYVGKQAQAPPPDEDRRLRRREPESPLLALLRNIFGSRANRFFMFSTVGLSFYLFNQWMQHQFRAVRRRKTSILHFACSDT